MPHILLARPLLTRHSRLPRELRTVADAIAMIEEDVPKDAIDRPHWLEARDCLHAARETGNAVDIEDSIEALSQPPYPIIPAHELYGTILLELRRPAEAAKHFAETLKRTPGRPMAVYGIARAAEVLGDRSTALERYTQFLDLWKHADHDRPELAIARRFIAAGGKP